MIYHLANEPTIKREGSAIMTVIDTIQRLIGWQAAASASDRIHDEVTAIRRHFVGKPAVERLPTGEYVAVTIREIDWEPSYYPGGGWAVRCEDTLGKSNWTSDRVLFFK